MNRTLLRRGSAILSAAAIAGLSTGVLSAHADTFSATCVPGGAAFSGDGSSFQAVGVAAEISAFAGCGSVTYTATGSGPGVTDFTNKAVQFAGTDIPYSDQQYATIQAAGPGHFETIPVALGGISVVFNEPCLANGTPLSGAEIALIYAGKVTNWNQVSPSCGSIAIGIWHRSGNSGTTTAFKTYLTKKDGADYAAGCGGTTCYKDPTPNWPNGAGAACAGGNTNAAMAACVSGTSGSIGYVDFAAVPAGMSSFAVDNAGGSLIDMLDLLGQHGTANTLGAAVGFSTLGFAQMSEGACTVAAQTNATPTTTAVDWSQVDVTDGPNGYGICTYTYQLAWDLPVTAHAATVAQAITIDNFISFETSDAGQRIWVSAKYDALPIQVQAAAFVAAGTLLTTN